MRKTWLRTPAYAFGNLKIMGELGSEKIEEELLPGREREVKGSGRGTGGESQVEEYSPLPGAGYTCL